jgi:hypothetical protein
LYLTVTGCTFKTVLDNNYGVYVIDNARFGIHSDRTNARATTDGINRAIEEAHEEGYTVVRFTAGEYLITCLSDATKHPTDGIFLCSNTTFDLGEAMFYVEPNSSYSYGVFQLERLENVTLTGGEIIGDKEEHTYPGNATERARHIFGSAFHIIGGDNILIRNVKMRSVIGAAIRIYANSEMRMFQMFPTDNIRITGCEFDNCGRNGIEVLHAIHMEIDNNRFTNFSNHIGNTNLWEVCGILAARWKDGRYQFTQLTNDIKVHDNYFENCGGAVVLVNSEDCEISDNYSEGGMMGIFVGRRIKIYRNTITEGYIQFGDNGTDYNEDICVPTEGANKNNCSLWYADIIHQTGNFRCD